ncbi:MAG TPA: 5'/3'-nucleotidase SurE [Ohtaekwangia sp.]|nr:5'/3'-nucleotidase SurE [Ohtaekwangia sp.]
MNRPLILVSNDDGITSKGILTLVNVMKEIGDVLVVAPDSPQSGMGHAITVGETLRLEQNYIFKDVQAFECSGTPADCVKIARHFVLKGQRQPDIVVSGVNHGSNTSISVLYSGTMSAAIEGAIEGTPAVGFSLCDYSHDADFSHTHEYIRKITLQVLDKGLPKGVALNVNFPPAGPEPLKGIRVCRQANAKWVEEFDQRYDPNGRRYFWMAGNFINFDKGEDNDEWAIANNYVAVVPCMFDLTAHQAIPVLNEDWEILT